MKKLRAIMAYFTTKYPHKRELTKARLTKLVYLADWFSALLDDKQISKIEWVFNHYGPYVDDVAHLANMDVDFDITHEKTYYGGDKYVISYSGKEVGDELTIRERAILDAIIEKTKPMYFNDFIDYVYSTHPISSSERYAILDLVTLAKKYKAQKEQVTA